MLEKGKLKKSKGKVKKHDRDLSIVIVPHFSGKVKTLKLTKLYSGVVLAVALIFLGTTIFSFCYANSTAHEISQLKSNVTSLIDVNQAQQTVIAGKNSKIKTLKSSDTTVKKVINEFLSKYRNITNNYLTNRSSSIISGSSGVSKDRAFASDIKELKNLIVKLKKLSDSDVKMAATINDVENKINSYLSAIPTSWPTSGGISSSYGTRLDPISYTYRFHDGVDISAGYGAAITSAGAGTVVSSGYDGAYGLKIIVSHGYGITSSYSHCSSSYVSVGEKVSKGETIGLVGSSGRTTGPHLHFMIAVNGSTVNPTKFLN